MSTSRPVALVTAGARRVGRAIASALAGAGCDLVLTYRDSEAEARSLRDELLALPAAPDAPRAVTLTRLELDDPDAVQSFAQRTAATLPRLDVLVHNASIYQPTPLQALTADAALTHYRVNALAPLLLSKALAPRLAESPLPGGGSIVAMCDIHAMDRPRARFSAYAMSKAALLEMVYTLAVELAPRVRVNAVAPGVVAFPEHGHESDAAMQARYLARVPMARSGTPQDAAEAVRWLALDATYCTGQVIKIDGGRWLT